MLDCTVLGTPFPSVAWSKVSNKTIKIYIILFLVSNYLYTTGFQKFIKVLELLRITYL